MTPLLTILSLIAGIILILALLFIIGQREDFQRGLNFNQKLIRAWYRVSRWAYAKAAAREAYLMHHHRGRAAERAVFLKQMQQPIPEPTVESSALYGTNEAIYGASKEGS